VLYIDTSVLLVYTLTQALEPARYARTRKLMAKIAAGRLAAATSFYALHEVYLFAVDNAPEFAAGAAFGKAALNKILRLPLQIFPLVPREQRRLVTRKLSALTDSSDVPHAVAALLHGCHAIVAYDEHFRAISDVIAHRTPADYA